MKATIGVTHYQDDSLLTITKEEWGETKTMSVTLSSTDCIGLALLLEDKAVDKETSFGNDDSTLVAKALPTSEVSLEIINDYDNVETLINMEGRLKLAERLREVPQSQYAQIL